VSEAIAVKDTAEAPPLGGLDELPLQIIEPSRGWVRVDWNEIWRYRELLYFLTWRDVKVRYKQTALGAAWAILQPLLTMIVFTLFFGRLAGFDKRTEGVPYPLYVYTGLILWTFFATSISSSGNSLVGNSNLISKVYFPRIVVPLAAVCAGLVDWAVSSCALLLMFGIYQIGVNWEVLYVPVFVVGTFLTAAGVGALLAALTVEFRDFRYVVPFLTQIWMFITPVIYPASIVPGRWRWLFSINPMSGLIEGFRMSFLPGDVDWSLAAISLLMSVGLFLAGATYFRRVERTFADVI
jgi:lipopolysaccharide transport system permease protein